MGLCRRGGLLVRSVQDVNPQTIFFLWVATRHRPVGWGVLVLCYHLLLHIWGGGHWGRKESFPLLLCGPCSLLPDHRSCPPAQSLPYDPSKVPSWDLMSAFHTAAFGSVIPASYQGQEPLSVSHWLCGIDLETS